MKILIIIGSTRQNRFSELPAGWIFNEAKKRADLEVELLDLRDYPLPFFDDPISPAMAKGEHFHPEAKKLAAKIAEADGYIIVTPEYNHSFPAVLKNAMDYIYYEWNNKPIGFVSYGMMGGARAVEQLRQVVVELQLVPIRASVQIAGQIFIAAHKHKPGDSSDPFETLRNTAESLLDQLLWWAKILKPARENPVK